MRNAWSLSFSTVLFASLTSCTPKPPDVPVCKHLAQRLATDPVSGHLLLRPSPTCKREIGEVECGRCTFIVSGKTFFVGEAVKTHFNGKPWSQLRRESILVPAVESYAPITAYMINSCKSLNCSDDVTKFKVKIDEVKDVEE